MKKEDWFFISFALTLAVLAVEVVALFGAATSVADTIKEAIASLSFWGIR